MSVPLAPLTIVEGPADAHGGGAEDAHEATQPEAAAEPEVGHGGSSHGDEHGTSASYNARGKVKLDVTGDWKATIILDDGTAKNEAEFSFDVEKGGPSPFYLAFTGTLMGGTILYSIATRINSKRNGGGQK